MIIVSIDNHAQTRSVWTLQDTAAYLFKIVFLGEGAVGKTSLVGRFVYDSFEGDYLATIGTDIHLKMVQVDDILVKLVIWDIAGQDGFAQLRKAYYMNASGAFLVFDTSRADTIERVDNWIKALYDVTGEIPLIICENKADLESVISQAVKDEVTKKHGVKMIKTSAKEDTNVEEAFQEMTREILERARKKSKKTM
ncbi:GTP-binding protein [Candidatus Thorarchaeota archaeon]|nr:MAG: GTP-binding protein [Candidatus Thorarchaeota archaeon]